MRFAIVGAGSIGGFMGARLARGGHEVALVARGTHLEAMQRGGLRLIGPKDDFTLHVPATSDPAEIGPVDTVIVTLKAHQLPPFAERLQPLLGPETTVVSAMNGLPWWYFQRHGGPWEGTVIGTLDPEGVISRVIAPERIIGCEVLPSAEIAEPGVIRHIWGERFPLGEPDGSKSERIMRLADIFHEIGFKAPVTERIRHDIWVKLMGNLAFNPISALTRATLQEMAEHDDTRAVVKEIMKEALAICERLGLHIEITPERRIEGARKVGHHKTSMLQDFEGDKPLELEAMVGAVLELGRKLEVPMPHTQAVYALTRLLCETRDKRATEGEPGAHEAVSVTDMTARATHTVTRAQPAAPGHRRAAASS